MTFLETPRLRLRNADEKDAAEMFDDRNNETCAHERWPAWDFLCFTDPKNVASMELLKKLGCADLGYLPTKDSRAFGKWLRPDTLEEIAQAQRAH